MKKQQAITLIIVLIATAVVKAQGPTKIYANVLQSSHDQGVWARAMTHDAVGNVYVTGFFHGTCDFDPTENGVSQLVYQGGTVNDVDGESDVYVAKYNANGDLVWAKNLIEPTFGGLNEERSTAITIDENNNLYLCGFTNTRGFFISKWDDNGNDIWSRYFDDLVANNVLTFGIKTIASGIVVSGFFRETVDFDPSPTTTSNLTAANNDGFLLSLTSDGNFQWVKQIQSNGGIILTGLTTTSSNEIVVTGTFLGTVDFNPDPAVQNLLTSASVSTGAVSSSFVAKYNADGTFGWVKHFRGNSTTDFIQTLVQVDNLGNFVISGCYKGIVTFAPGNQVASTENYNSFIAKINTTGTLLWVKKIAATDGLLEEGICANMTLDPCGNIFVSGEFTGTCDFDPSSEIHSLTSLTNTSAEFVAMYSPEGNYNWAFDIKGLGSPASVEFNGHLPITIDSSQNLVIAGSFRGILDFDPSPTATFNLTSNSLTPSIAGVFLSKYENSSPCLLASNEFEKPAILLYPNPAKNIVTISFDQFKTDIKLQIINAQGQIVFEDKNKVGSSISIEVGGLAKGIYVLKVAIDGTTYSKKLLIE